MRNLVDGERPKKDTPNSGNRESRKEDKRAIASAVLRFASCNPRTKKKRSSARDLVRLRHHLGKSRARNQGRGVKRRGGEESWQTKLTGRSKERINTTRRKRERKLGSTLARAQNTGETGTGGNQHQTAKTVRWSGEKGWEVKAGTYLRQRKEAGKKNER